MDFNKKLFGQLNICSSTRFLTQLIQRQYQHNNHVYCFRLTKFSSKYLISFTKKKRTADSSNRIYDCTYFFPSSSKVIFLINNNAHSEALLKPREEKKKVSFKIIILQVIVILSGLLISSRSEPVVLIRFSRESRG